MFALRLSVGQIIGLLDRRALSTLDWTGRDGIIYTNYANSDPPGRMGCVHITRYLTSGRFPPQVLRRAAWMPDRMHLSGMYLTAADLLRRQT
jgi:hypothetical protein